MKKSELALLCRTKPEGMSLVFILATVASMDAGVEPPGMGSRRVAEMNARFMPITKS